MSKIDKDGMIERMIESVDSWDFDSLVGFAKDTLDDIYRSLPTSDLEEQYNNMFAEYDAMTSDDLLDDEITAHYDKVERCPNCSREKDVGQKCWWCGA